ncbi:hypothetical protein HOD05_04430 [Candidatus Woesearchaeota archaeon]|jgi:hypothetical protein|nr:hypothetical protein [Candidatus Woesearchaeota archaeon]MBT4247726.1 hypothetical protein [Candidatus Woesearchaeota archaeon]MBT4434440.1 hypothetical protein [Candidatus Woesearchaeota archaeon]
MALTKYEIINTFPTLDKLVDSSFKINEAFFQNFLSKQTIYVARNREEYNREFGCPTQDWMVGYHCTPKSHILIMSPEGLEQTGFHERDSFSQILTHEINHRFMSDLYEFSFPIWVFEGLACYVANQFNESKLTDDIIDFPFDRMHYSDFYANSKYTYSKSGGFTNYLVNTYGEKSLLTFIEEVNGKTSSEMDDIILKSFQKTLTQLQGNWNQYLWDRYADSGNTS